MKLYAVLPFVLQAIAWPIAHAIFRLSGSCTISGFENIRGITGPVVFAANHVNDIDPVLTRAMLPWFSKPLFWVARFRKDYDAHAVEPFEGWRGFLYSDWFFRSWGAYPAYKGTGDYEKSLRHHLALLQEGYRVCIFPQGGKAKYMGREAPVHGGAAYLAARAGVPLVPVAIAGTLHLGPRELFFGKRELKVTIGKPLSVPQASPEAPPEFYRLKTTEAVTNVYEMLDEVSVAS